MEKSVAPTIGIDLGTTYSCVAVWRNDRVEIIQNDLGNRTTPSVVAFTDLERLIGEGALNQAAMNPTNTIFDSKRLIGRLYSDPYVQADMKTWPFKVIGHSDKPIIVVGYMGEEKEFRPELISSMVLTKMKETAEAYLGTEVINAVVTVPAYFNNSQRQATSDAGAVAGLKIVQMINEPTAAAIAYGLDKKIGSQGKKNVLVFDLGGGTVDVSLVTIEGGNFKVNAVTGDSHLGGQDFDVRMVEYLAEEFKRKYKKNISDKPKAMRRLRKESEKVKRLLSVSVLENINIDSLYDGIDFVHPLSRSRFEQLNMDYFETCIKLVETCLIDGRMDKGEVHDVVLVGGSSRIPMIQKMLKEFFDGKELCRSINPDEAIAYGAAVQATLLTSEKNEKITKLTLLDVTPLSLGIELQSGEMSVLIARNTPVPVTQEKVYYNSVDYGTKVGIDIFEGEKVKAKDNHLLGTFILSGIRPALRQTVAIKVCFRIDANGILHVTAEEIGTGNTNQITITDNGKMSQEEIKKMIKESEEYIAKDLKQKNMAKAKNDLENYVIKMEIASLKLAPEDKKGIEHSIAQGKESLENVDSSTEPKDLEDLLKKLENLWKSFIQ